jgi:DNA-binding transcriptional MerR regulator
MYSIGEFSLISKLSKKTLRYYDEIDLLKPCEINRDNGYRYYDEKQFILSKEILNYKNLGLSLDEIKKIIYNSNIEISKILNNRLLEIEDQIKILKLQEEKIRILVSGEYSNTECNYNISFEKVEFKSGYIFKIKTNIKNNEYGKEIGYFYEKINKNNIEIISKHMMKIDLNREKNDLEIFAFSKNKNPYTEKFERCDAIKVLCENLEDKSIYYKSLFDYSKDNDINIKFIVEEYFVIRGKIRLNIYMCY